MGTNQHRSWTTLHSRRAIGLLLVLVMVLSLVSTLFLSAPHAALAASVTTTANLNLRAGPSYDDKVLTVMPSGSAVTVNGDPRDGFYPVSYHGTSGWALGTYLSLGTIPPDQSASSTPASAVTTDWLNLRAGPSLGADVLTVMPVGASATLKGDTRNGFAAVSYGGRDGWASTAYLKIGTTGQAAAPAASGWVTTADLNLRAGPSTSNAVLTVMPEGSAVTVTGPAQSGFYPISYQGTNGWASGAYLTQAGNGRGSQGGTAASGSSTGDQIVDLIYAAADKYGQSRADMLRVARCESNLNPRAVGGGSFGLFQFTRGTWASTPYAGDDIFDPQANANAAGWMWSVGRRGEWVCQ
ncbi:MAG TPA: SH3 domain-containing protein [Thermomicrobiaceae bacterium]|nr:SH3 domain-containing protein [Thermomicrobiaceae bacterium]